MGTTRHILIFNKISNTPHLQNLIINKKKFKQNISTMEEYITTFFFGKLSQKSTLDACILSYISICEYYNSDTHIY